MRQAGSKGCSMRLQKGTGLLSDSSGLSCLHPILHHGRCFCALHQTMIRCCKGIKGTEEHIALPLYYKQYRHQNEQTVCRRIKRVKELSWHVTAWQLAGMRGQARDNFVRCANSKQTTLCSCSQQINACSFTADRTPVYHLNHFL